jgi:hypothetical protein
MGVLMNNKSSKMMMKHDAGDNENDKGILKWWKAWWEWWKSWNDERKSC